MKESKSKLKGEEAKGGERKRRKGNKLRAFRKIKYNLSALYLIEKMDGRANFLD